MICPKSLLTVLAFVIVLPACNGAAISNHPGSVDEASNIDTQKESTGAELMTEREREVIEKMLWVEVADPHADAKLTLEKAMPELIAFAGRGLSYPGLTEKEFALIKTRVTYKVIEGSGDTIYGKMHRNLRRQLKTYAEVYNRRVFSALK